MHRSKTDLVPFGKYRGQPVEVLAQDTKYCEWLQTQPWFSEKFPGIQVLVINGHVRNSEKECTPVHNVMQAKLLDSLTLTSLIKRSSPRVSAALELNVKETLFEEHNWDVFARCSMLECQSFYDRGEDLVYMHPHLEKIQFTALVECKPHLSDDYPQVIRTLSDRLKKTLPKLRSSHLIVLWVESYSGTVPLSKVASMFKWVSIMQGPVDHLTHIEPEC